MVMGMLNNVQQIEAHLLQYTENERIYREYAEAVKHPGTLRDFSRRVDLKKALEMKLILPDLYPECVPGANYFCDQNVFSPGSNVLIEKHDRYTPVFLHEHDFFEMNYVVSGSCTQQIQGRRVVFRKGDFCFIALHSPHTIEVFDESVVLNILIRHDTFDDLFMNDLRSKNLLTTFFLENLYQSNRTDYIIFHTKDDENIRDSIFELYLESLAQDQYSDRMMVHMIAVLFNQLLRTYSRTATVSENRDQEFHHQIEVVVYLEQNYRTATLADTAEHFNYSTAYCSKLIKRTTGSNFVDLLREIRLKQAERLLRTTPASLEIIADRIGYENVGSFIRVFKQNRGVTPTQYRNCKSNG